MTDSCDIDVEVGGCTGISNPAETVTESRKDSIAKEETPVEKKNSQYALEKMIVWQTFKNVVFFICLVCLIIQSVEFFNIYYKYPTNIVMEITVAQEFKLPAITLCFRNTISFKKFCSYEPESCKRPSNWEEFCRQYSFHCNRVESDVTIPIQGIETEGILQGYLYNDTYNDDARLFRDYDYTSKVRTFVDDIGNHDAFLKCYSDNLHLYQSGTKPKTFNLDLYTRQKDWILLYALDQTNIHLFYPEAKPQVFVAIHSPYLPVNPMKLHAVRPGKRYLIDVQLEKEEHLLPPPYQTNCKDNGPSEDVKESIIPNSHQMCLELCRSEYSKAMLGCVWGMTMVPSVDDVCYQHYEEPTISSEQRAELWNKRLLCFQNCRQGCLKLQYRYTVKEEDYHDVLTSQNDPSNIRVYVKNPEVTVLKHRPLYGSGEVFSHVGGLLGCWLGISVFTFTDLMEKFFRNVFGRITTTKKKKEQQTTTSEML